VNDLDQKIREALASEEAEFSTRTVEPPLLEQVIDTFRGRNRWLVMLSFVFALVWLAVAVVTAIEFFEAESTRAMLAWACGFVLSMITIGMIKIWYWIELAKNSVLREVKRVELRVVRLGDGK